jgi:hypothetical protein
MTAVAVIVLGISRLIYGIEVGGVAIQYLAEETWVAWSTAWAIYVCFPTKRFRIALVVLIGCLIDDSEVASAYQDLEAQ